MKKMKSLGAPRRGVVWATSPNSSEYPDASDYDNTYPSEAPVSTKRPTSVPAAPHLAPANRERRVSFTAFLHDHFGMFRGVVWG